MLIENKWKVIDNKWNVIDKNVNWWQMKCEKILITNESVIKQHEK